MSRPSVELYSCTILHQARIMQAEPHALRTEIRGVLIDLGGVVYVGDTALPGSIEALRRLNSAGLPIRFITNTTRTPKRALLSKLAGIGIDIAAEQLLTPAEIARGYLIQHRLSPWLLVHQSLEEDFAGLPRGTGRRSSLAT